MTNPSEKIPPHLLAMPLTTTKAGFFVGRYEHSVRPDVEFEMLLRPEYWKHVAATLQRNSIVSVVSESEKFYAELFAMDVSPLIGVQMAVLRHIDLRAERERYNNENLPSIKDGYKIQRGIRGWILTRISDNTKIADELPTKEAAEVELDRYLSAMSR